MELKLTLSPFEYSGTAGLNRTFMELKRDGKSVTPAVMRVLIVPLWN